MSRSISRIALFLAVLLAVTTLAGRTAEAAAAKPDHVIWGYIPTYRDQFAPPKDFDLSAFTHLARAFLRPQVDGSLTVAPNYFNSEFEQRARAAGVKLIMSIGGASRAPDPWKAIATDPAAVKKLIETLDVLYREHQYDGVDIDWEPPPQNEVDAKGYSNLIRQIRERFPKKLLVITLAGKHYALKSLPLTEILPNVDFVNAMFYDYNASWTGVASFATNLNRDASPDAGTNISVNEGLSIMLKDYQIPPAKLVLGTNFFAYRFRASKVGEKFPKNGKGMADDLEYGLATDLLVTGQYAKARSESAGADYLLRKGGGSLITLETPETIKAKCERAKELNLAGVMIWGAGSDSVGGRMPLLSAMAESFGMRPLPVSQPLLAFDVARLGGKPVAAGTPLAALQKTDEALRAKRAQAEDERWMNLPATLKK